MIAIISWNEKEEITTPTPIESSRETTTEAAAISSEVKDLVNYFFELQLKEGKILDLEYKKHLENILDIKC